MMSKTHIAVGLASATAILLPNSFEIALPVIAGAAIGSLISDIDCKSNSYMKDALYGRIIVAIIVGVSFFMDLLIGGQILSNIFEGNIIIVVVGVIGLFFVGLLARISKHRGFSHSLLAMVLAALALALISVSLVPSFLIAFLSHLFLDIVNKKGIRIFYPSKKEICFNWFYADKTANTVFLVVGCLGFVFSLMLIVST